MKIAANPIGNYAPQFVSRVNSQTRTSESAAVQHSKPTTSAQVTNITKEERQYFARMYPENRMEIMDYHFYQKSGRMSGVSLGSLFDKRG